MSEKAGNELSIAEQTLKAEVLASVELDMSAVNLGIPTADTFAEPYMACGPCYSQAIIAAESLLNWYGVRHTITDETIPQLINEQLRHDCDTQAAAA